jgi:hypothetical protein
MTFHRLFFIICHSDHFWKVSTRLATLRAHVWLVVTENCC